MRPRIPNNGPPMTLADLWPLLQDFAEINSRSTEGVANTISSTSGPVMAALTTQFIDAPTQAAPDGYEWALRAEFTGNCEILAPSTNTLFVLQLEVLEAAPNTWQALSDQDSGGVTTQLLFASVPAVGEHESIAVHATRTLASLPLPLAATQTIRVAWGIQGASSTARFESGSEVETGGWDLTVKWVLQPEPVV
jgi:hypothetical protein